MAALAWRHDVRCRAVYQQTQWRSRETGEWMRRPVQDSNNIYEALMSFRERTCFFCSRGMCVPCRGRKARGESDRGVRRAGGQAASIRGVGYMWLYVYCTAFLCQYYILFIDIGQCLRQKSLNAYFSSACLYGNTLTKKMYSTAYFTTAENVNVFC